MELRGLFQYLVNQLKKGDGIELVLLQVLFRFNVILCSLSSLLDLSLQFKLNPLSLMDTLQELVQQMANVQYTENMTEEQLDAMAGSDTLRYQVTSFGVTRNNKVHCSYSYLQI